MAGPVKAYDVVVDGNRTRLKLTEDEAKRRGLTDTTTQTKKRSAPNKALPAPERPAGNASTADWQAYAKAVGVEVPDDAGRNDIRDIVDAT